VNTSGDFGGVHVNSGIPNHMYYLAIMGGTNRVSGLSVTGVGFDHRDLIEKVIYRAFTQLMPANATFSVARAATIQSARDLYGAGSPAEAAITQAWTAVGVF
jgi:thermolysin